MSPPDELVMHRRRLELPRAARPCLDDVALARLAAERNDAQRVEARGRCGRRGGCSGGGVGAGDAGSVGAGDVGSSGSSAPGGVPASASAWSRRASASAWSRSGAKVPDG